MEPRPEVPQSTQPSEASHNPPPHEDVTVRREPVVQPATTGDQGIESRQVESELPETELAGAKTVISKPRSTPIPAHPGKHGEPAEIASVLLGHQLGHFELQSLIGGGGMGAVFRARDTRLDRTVAIKVIPRVGEDAELQRRFRNEAQSAARLEHPNIARIYDVGEHGGWHYIVFEYIEGINLRDLVFRDGVVSIDDAVYYTRQIAEALEHASRRGVTHRDIKPSNVLITPAGAVKLVDMGLARAQQLEMSEDMTASGVTLGTFDYISPEQAKDPRDADVRSDIYSLGCTLFFSLTGRPPYGGGTPLQKLLSHGSSPLPDPNQFRAGVSENLVAILFKMMAKDPSSRYRRPLDLIADLYQLAERENLARSLSAGSITVVPGNRFLNLLEQHLPWVIAAGILFLSTGWLQLLSSASGDLEFSEPVPTLQATARNSSGVSPDNGRRGNTQPLPSALPVGAAASDSGNLGEGPAMLSNPPVQSRGQRDAGATDAAQPPDLGASLGGPKIEREPAENLSVDLGVPRSSGAAEDGIRKVVRVIESTELDNEGAGNSETWFVTTLQEALELAAEDSRIEAIEIGARRIRSGPIRIPARSLTIRGISSSTVWELQSPAELGDRQPLAMVELNSPNLSIENIHLLWRFPSASAAGGALFSIPDSNTTNTLRFENCSLTIENVGQDTRVYAFELAPTEGAAAVGDGNSSLVGEPLLESGRVSSGVMPLFAIKMSDVIVRGQMTMLSIERPTRLEFLWENGLLAVDGGLLRCVGAFPAAVANPPRMRFILNDLTSVTGDSLLRMRVPAGMTQSYLMDRESARCVFTVNEGVPLVSLEGVGDGGAVEDFLVLRGRDNYYDAAEGRTQLILRATTTELREVFFRTQELLGTARPRWVQELSPQDFVSWKKSLPSGRMLHLATPEDFLQEGVVLPGFRYEDLPKNLPEIIQSGGL